MMTWRDLGSRMTPNPAFAFRQREKIAILTPRFY